MIELRFMKELMLMRQANQKSARFCMVDRSNILIFELCFMLCFITHKPTFFKKYFKCLVKYFMFQSKYESCKYS